VHENGAEWSEEQFSFSKLHRVPVSGPYLQARLANAAPEERRWLLVKAWREDVSSLLAEGSKSVPLSGALLFEGSSAEMMLARHQGFYPVALDLTWRSAMSPHLVFVAAVVAALVACIVGLFRLQEEYTFPILHPIMATLRVYANDGNPVSVLVSINQEMQTNLQGTAAGHESDLWLTDSWILHVVPNDVEVSPPPLPPRI